MDLLSDLSKAEELYQQALEKCIDNAPEIFRRARRRFGWSQRNLARLLGCNYTYISKIENARLRPGRPILKKLGELIKKESRKVNE